MLSFKTRDERWKKRSDDDDEDIFKSCETADDRLTSNQGEGEDRERQQGKKGKDATTVSDPCEPRPTTRAFRWFDNHWHDDTFRLRWWQKDVYRSGRGTIWRSGRILPIYEAWITRKAEEEGQVMDGPPRACENQCEKAFLNHHVCNMIGATSCNSLFIVDWSPLHHSSFIAAQFCEPHTPYTYELWRKNNVICLSADGINLTVYSSPSYVRCHGPARAGCTCAVYYTSCLISTVAMLGHSGAPCLLPVWLLGPTSILRIQFSWLSTGDIILLTNSNKQGHAMPDTNE